MDEGDTDRPIGLLSIFLMAIWMRIVYVNQKSQEMPPYAGFREIDPAKNHFILVGDTQRTSHWEFWRERNEKERKQILEEIVRRGPAFVLHLGDLTTRGSSEKHWHEFDDLNKVLREKKIPYFPILGNHEFYGNDEKALQYYFNRFPHLRNKRWYSFTWKNIGLVMVDSNFATLAEEQTKRQAQWYLNELERFDKDGGIEYVMVCCHHPPFTNSRVISPNEKSKLNFADPFVRFRKTCFFFSGHSHTYERFKIEGKLFIVTGGGGGPRHKVSIDSQNRRFDDLFPGPGLRFFHFCEVENHGRVFDYKLLRLEPNGTFTVADSLTLS